MDDALAMRRSHRLSKKFTSPASGSGEGAGVLPSLATAEQIGAVLQVTPRTVLYWADAGTIPTALRQGKIVRFHPPAVAAALGLDLPEFGLKCEGAISPQHPDQHHQ